jgi:hypothetical protein
MLADLTICDIPLACSREFGEKIVQSQYPSELNEAIKDSI